MCIRGQLSTIRQASICKTKDAYDREVQLRERGGSFIPQNCDGEQPQY